MRDAKGALEESQQVCDQQRDLSSTPPFPSGTPRREGLGFSVKLPDRVASHHASHFSRLRIDHFKDMPAVGSSLLSLRDAKDALEEIQQVCGQHRDLACTPQ